MSDEKRTKTTYAGMDAERIDRPGVQIFICRGRQQVKECATPNCHNPVVGKCRRPVSGRPSPTCDRLVCRSCARPQPDGGLFCPPHDNIARATR